MAVAAMLASTAYAQVCAAPGKDAPGTISGIVNTYYQGNGNLAVLATGLTLGAASGAAGTVTVGDKLLIIQIQGAAINTSNNERYGDNVGAAATPDTSASQANGYTALNLAGGYEYVQVATAAGNVITFTPALTNAYEQNVGAQPRRTYQVIRVPQLPSATIASGSPVTPLGWTGLVGGVVAIDVSGRLTFTGAGPHIEASNRGFRGGDQGVNDSSFPNASRLYRSANTADGGSKGEGIAGTPRYVQTSTVGTYNDGTRFSDGAPTRTDNGGGHMGYNQGNYRRGAPANAGGGGNSHNAAGGGGGNGGEGGNGGQTFNDDGLLDTGGYGGSRTPQDGVLLATRIFMGGGGGSGSLNNGTSPRGSGGNGGGIIVVRTGSVSGAGVLRTDGQRAWDSDVSNDAGGGGGAGGSVLLIAGSGHSNITVQARGGDGADSNITTGSLAFAPPNGDQGGCCGGEREGPGGGGGGGALYANATVGSLALGGGINGLSREDKAAGFSGNMRAAPGSTGASLQTIAASAILGAREGYACVPTLTVNKLTNTPALAVPPNTSGTYIINVSNATGLSGVAYGIAITDALSSPFQLTGTTATINYSAGASGPASPMTISGAGTVVIGTAGSPTNAFTLNPGANVTVTFKVGLNGATAGTYQNPANINYTDPTRTTGGVATAVTNPAVTPGGTNAAGDTVPGTNYASGSSTQEDIVITGVAGTTADLGLTKSGPASVEIGQAVQYTLNVTNSGPSNISGTISVADNVPAALGTVTWSCSVVAGTADCDTSAGGTSAAGSGNAINLPRVAMSSGGELSIVISSTAISAGSITNTATVSVPAGFTDPTPGNNTGTATTVISTPTADMNVTKTNGVTSVFANGVTAYIITVANAGPSAANNAVVADPATTGLLLVSVSCSGAGGAVCPAGLTTTTFRAGATVPTFPAGSTLTFTANNSITAGSGTVTNTVTITAPPGLIEINAGNNSATDSDAVTLATSAVVSAAQICPAGTTEQLTNLLTNSDYANTAASVGAFVTQAAFDTQPADTGVSIQAGPKNYGPDVVVQAPFPGDSARSVGSTNNWLYNNGNNTGGAYRYWSQAVTGLVLGRTYEWLYYGSNALNRGRTDVDLPTIEMRVLTTTTFTLAANSFPNEGAGTSDTWTLRQSVFQATVTSVTLQLWDAAPGSAGDDFASTQVLLRECKPNTDPFVTKTNSTSTLASFATTAYVITVGNNGPGPADGIIVKDPTASGLNKTAINCAATGAGAACPASSTIAGVEGAGLTIPTLPVNTTVIFTITASVTALNGTVTNTVNLQLAAGMTDDNLGNNSGADADGIRGLANISVSKTNGTNTVVAGRTTAYTITVANGGPSDASGSVISDPVAPGLSCVAAATCSGSGGASCTASIPAATLQSGYTIPALPSGGQINIVLTCGVTVTGL